MLSVPKPKIDFLYQEEKQFVARLVSSVAWIFLITGIPLLLANLAYDIYLMSPLTWLTHTAAVAFPLVALIAVKRGYVDFASWAIVFMLLTATTANQIDSRTGILYQLSNHFLVLAFVAVVHRHNKTAIITVSSTIAAITTIMYAAQRTRPELFDAIPRDIVVLYVIEIIVLLIFTITLWTGTNLLERRRIHLLESHRAKNTFLANMSHELRTPLHAILGYAQIIEKKVGDPEIELDAQAIHASGRILLELVENLLSLEKAEAGQMEAQLSLVKINDFIQWSQSAARGLLLQYDKSDEITFHWKNRVGQDEFLMDKSATQHIVLNLMSNAVKFTERGQISVNVYQLKKELVFAVKDEGVGIKDDHLNIIFKRFAQVDHHYAGAGIGLSISQELARLQGGYIDVASQVGLGSTFKLHIPIINNETDTLRRK